MKNKNFTLMTLLAAGMFIVSSGCQKDENENQDYISPGTEDGNIAKSIVGRGYDISQRFAYSEDIKEAVLDFNQLANDQMIIKDGNISSTEVKVVEGETIQGYQASFSYASSATVGVEGMFSAEAGVNFGYERTRMSGYSYATVSSFTYKYGMYVDGRQNPSTLTDYVSSQFLSDAESMTSEELIDTYGTHVIVGGKWGASFDYSMSAKRISSSDQYSFGAFTRAEATVNGINLGGSTEISAEFSNYYESSSKTVYTKAKGGNSEYALAIATATTNEARDAAYAAWVETIDENPAFCDYYQEGLVPLYEFIADEALKATVQNGIEAYMEANEIETVEPVESTINSDFHVANFCHTISGDSEIDADGGGDIYVEVNFVIEEQIGSNNLDLKIDMKVHEMKGDYSKIEGITNKTIVNNDPINSIELNNTSYTFSVQESFDPDNGEYFSPVPFIDTNNQPPAWLTNLKICIDGSGGDEEVIGVKGSVSIPVTIYDF